MARANLSIESCAARSRIHQVVFGPGGFEGVPAPGHPPSKVHRHATVCTWVGSACPRNTAVPVPGATHPVMDALHPWGVGVGCWHTHGPTWVMLCPVWDLRPVELVGRHCHWTVGQSNCVPLVPSVTTWNQWNHLQHITTQVTWIKFYGNKKCVFATLQDL